MSRSRAPEVDSRCVHRWRRSDGEEPTVSVSSYGFLVRAAWFAVAIRLTYWFGFAVNRGARRPSIKIKV